MEPSGRPENKRIIGWWGHYYYRARFYSPQLGRFVSRDLFGYTRDRPLINYATSRPVQKVDPTGFDSESPPLGPKPDHAVPPEPVKCTVWDMRVFRGADRNNLRCPEGYTPFHHKEGDCFVLVCIKCGKCLPLVKPKPWPWEVNACVANEVPQEGMPFGVRWACGCVRCGIL